MNGGSGYPYGLLLAFAEVVAAARDLQVSAVVGVVEADDALRETGRRRLRWSSAGHLPPVLVGPDGAGELLSTPPDLLLGVSPTAARGDHERLVRDGSTVLLYTDGLVERRGEDLARALDRLPTAVAVLADLPLPELLDALVEELVPEGAEDDVALLAVRFGAEPPRDALRASR